MQVGKTRSVTFDVRCFVSVGQHPGTGGGTPSNASRLTPQTPTSLPEVFAHSPGGLTPTRIWGPNSFNFLKCDPRGLVVSSRSLRHVEIIISLRLQYSSDFQTEEATVNSVALLFAKRF